MSCPCSEVYDASCAPSPSTIPANVTAATQRNCFSRNVYTALPDGCTVCGSTIEPTPADDAAPTVHGTPATDPGVLIGLGVNGSKRAQLSRVPVRRRGFASCVLVMIVLMSSGCGNASEGRSVSSTRSTRSTVEAKSTGQSPRLAARPRLGADLIRRPEPILNGRAARSFAALQRDLGSEGQISIAIQPLGSSRVTVVGGDPQMIGMSTTKILVLAALLRERGGVANLTAEQRALARAAITESDNRAVLDLFSMLESDRGGLIGASAYMTSLLREAGDRQTSVATGPTPPALCDHVWPNGLAPDSGGDILPLPGARLSARSGGHKLRPRPDENDRALRELGPWVGGFYRGRVQRGVGPIAGRRVRRPPDGDHRVWQRGGDRGDQCRSSGNVHRRDRGSHRRRAMASG